MTFGVMKPSNSPSTSIPLERLGPAGIRGELHVFAIMENEVRRDEDRLRDATPRRFKVSGRLGKSPQVAEDIKEISLQRMAAPSY